ncbi:MAG: type II secretion system F family protein [Aquificaceae bacterium]|nr:type II secretion system F family protein [Aquificaceae bacterium]
MKGIIKNYLELRKGGISYYDLSFVLIELSMLLESGLTLIRAIEVASSQSTNSRIKEALIEVKTAIEGGETLHRAFSKAGVFPEFFLEMLKVAERGENLEKILRIAGEYLQKIEENKMKVLTSLAYPSFVIVASLLALFVAVKFVVPKIANVLQGLGKDLPLITKALLFFSHLLSYLIYFLPAFAMLYLFRHKLISKERWDKYFLMLPIFGKVSFYYNLSRLAGTLLMALSSGIPLTKAISLSLGSLNNAYLRSVLSGVDKEVSKGRSLSLVLKERWVLPDTFINLLALGEKSGELEKSLKMLQDMYERQAERIIAFWLRFAEPIAMLLVGLLVALIVLSVVLPLSEISTGIKG